MQMTTPVKQGICMSNTYQATVNYQIYLFLNKSKLFHCPRQMYSETVVTSD